MATSEPSIGPAINTPMDLCFAPDDPLPWKDRTDLQRVICPNVYLVLHLQPHVVDDLDRRWEWSLERADRFAYKFVANISRLALGKTAYRKRPPHRKRLPNITTLEHQGGFPHLNVCVRRPDKCPFDRFEELCRSEFRRLPHFRHTKKGFFCEEVIGNCIPYSAKPGSTILERTMSFIR